MADWVPPSGSKRARSPVEKLADLQMQEDEDEDNWRTSKRYFTEVIASGFSRLNFGKELQRKHGHEQQQQHPSVAVRNFSLPALQDTQQTPRDTDVDMLCSPRGVAVGNLPRSARLIMPLSQGEACEERCPIISPASSAHQPRDSWPNSPTFPASADAPGVCSSMADAVQLQLPKHVEKHPNSPSDIPASGGNLRKVALLRSLLVRTEQHLQHHQQPEQNHEAADHVEYSQQQLPIISDCSLLADKHQLQEKQQAGPSCSEDEEHQLRRPRQLRLSPHQAIPRPSDGQSDDMECSSSSSLGDSNGTLNAASACAEGPDLASSLLFAQAPQPSKPKNIMPVHHQQMCHSKRATEQSTLPARRGPQHSQQQSKSTGQSPSAQLPAPQYGVSMQIQACTAGSLRHVQQQQQQQHTVAGHLPFAACLQVPQQQLLQPGQQVPCKLKHPELSRERMEALRAKALASTSKLTTSLDPEEVYSLQLSITASNSRRGCIEHAPRNKSF